MEFNSHTDKVVRVAVGLVNLLTPGSERGREYRPPEGEERTAAVSALLRSGGGRRDATWEEAASFCFVAAELREVFAAVDSGAVDPAALDSAAALVNAMLARTGARPVLERHDGEPWHLHFHANDNSLASGWAAGCAAGLAVVLGGELYDRLGVCTAPRCDRVYVDTSRNGTRRYCSTSCQNRVKTAAFRARLSLPGAHWNRGIFGVRSSAMFERFTDQARQAVVLAREEAGLLDHDYIGTEHLLLGLITQGRGPAAQVLSSLGITLDSMRGEVGTAVGRSQPPAGPSGHVRLTPFGHIPFTPRAKKVLELSLREALRYGHDFVGTEHILLSILSEGGGLAVPLLEKRGADAAQIRQRIQQHFADDPDAAAGEVTPGSGHVPGPRRGHLPRPLRVAWDEVLPLVEAIEARLTAIEEHLGITAEAPDTAGESPRTAADDAPEQEPP